MIYVLIILILAIIEIIFSARISRALIIFNTVMCSILSLVLAWPKDVNFLSIAVYVLVIVSLILINAIVLYWENNKQVYDFRKNILSFASFLNMFVPKTSNRIVGKIMPYKESQLKYNGKFIVSNEVSLSGGVLIQGSVGSGKTYEIVQFIKQDIRAGRAVISSEFKGDPEVADKTINYSKNYDYDVYYIKPNALGELEYNFNFDPVSDINSAGIIEALINMRKWSVTGADGFYKQGMQVLLQKLVVKFSRAYNFTTENGPDPVAEKEIYEIYDNYVFNLMQKENAYGNMVPIVPHAKLSKRPYLYGFYEYCKNYKYTRDESDAYNSIVKSLEILMTSAIGDMFKFIDNSKKVLNIKDLLNKKILVVISFPSSNKELATSFTALFVKNLLDMATINKNKRLIMNYMDEFASLENPFIVKDLLEKERSARISTTLALQDVSQVVIQTNDAYMKSLLSIINTFIIFSGATKDSAGFIEGVQIDDIGTVIMNLRKPLKGKPPTALYITRYPSVNTMSNFEVFRFIPYVLKDNNKTHIKEVEYNPDKNLNQDDLINKIEELDDNQDNSELKEIDVSIETQTHKDENNGLPDSYDDFI